MARCGSEVQKPAHTITMGGTLGDILGKVAMPCGQGWDGGEQAVRALSWGKPSPASPNVLHTN